MSARRERGEERRQMRGQAAIDATVGVDRRGLAETGAEHVRPERWSYISGSTCENGSQEQRRSATPVAEVNPDATQRHAEHQSRQESCTTGALGISRRAARSCQARCEATGAASRQAAPANWASGRGAAGEGAAAPSGSHAAARPRAAAGGSAPTRDPDPAPRAAISARPSAAAAPCASQRARRRPAAWRPGRAGPGARRRR